MSEILLIEKDNDREDLIKDHEEFFSELLDANLSYSCGGMGGCPHFSINNHPPKFITQILKCLEDSEYTSANAFVDYVFENYNVTRKGETECGEDKTLPDSKPN